MKVLRTVKEVQEHRTGRNSVGLVPTMGAFHNGHLELMRRAVEECETAYVSLFVNPTQFGADEDLGNYPRDEKHDVEQAQSQGVHAIFIPSAEEIYTPEVKQIKAASVSNNWEGKHRPGHFDGVATVVNRLFDIFKPDTAYFGQKDFQQCAVIQQMVDELDLPINIVPVETVRDDNGLALSSRNVYFEPDEREKASKLFKVLSFAAQQFSSPQCNVKEIQTLAVTQLRSLGFDVEYLAVVDPLTMNELSRYSPNARVICAANFCGVRLIDNVACL